MTNYFASIVNKRTLQDLSKVRISEAKVLLDNGYFAGAYYLSGYAVECAIKACIAAQIRQHEIPERKLVNDFYTHDLELLVRLAGLKPRLDMDIQTDATLARNWTLVKDWRVESRYDAGTSEVRARDFYSDVKARTHGMLAWINRCM